LYASTSASVGMISIEGTAILQKILF